MAHPDQGNSTSTNQDRDTGMASNPAKQDRGVQDGEQDQWSKRSGERDGGQARRQSREDPQVSGTPDAGEA